MRDIIRRTGLSVGAFYNYYRSKEEVAEWRARDPIPAFGELLVREGVLDQAQRAAIDARAIARVDAAVAFAENSPFPSPESLYDDVYVLDAQVHGTYSVSTTGVQEPQLALADGSDEIPQQITDALVLGEDAS